MMHSLSSVNGVEVQSERSFHWSERDRNRAEGDDVAGAGVRATNE